MPRALYYQDQLTFKSPFSKLGFCISSLSVFRLSFTSFSFSSFGSSSSGLKPWLTSPRLSSTGRASLLSPWLAKLAVSLEWWLESEEGSWLSSEALKLSRKASLLFLPLIEWGGGGSELGRGGGTLRSGRDLNPLCAESKDGNCPDLRRFASSREWSSLTPSNIRCWNIRMLNVLEFCFYDIFFWLEWSLIWNRTLIHLTF